MNNAPAPSRFGKRGMHLNGWAINYPYTFRSWSEQDWHRYLDLLARQGINLFLFWPFMEIMPLPLSGADADYLAECRRVVAYAQSLGMEVWIMQSPNRVATGDCGVKDPRQRPYWDSRVQVDHNPADPQQMRAIMAAREVLYRSIDNADGYLTIDCDPGGWAGCPVEHFVDIFKQSRKLLDRYAIKGPATKQICWLWFGWHWKFDPASAVTSLEIIREEIVELQRGLSEPWELVAGLPGHLPLCRELGVLEKTVFLPYNVLEDEPSLPFTCIRHDQIAATFDIIDHYPELSGIMANVQCPLLQLPNCHAYCKHLFADPSDRWDSRRILDDLSSRIFPDHAELLTAGFNALLAGRADEIDRIAASLQQIAIAEIESVGDIGEAIFPEPRHLVDDLIDQLQIRSAEEAVIVLGAENADLAALQQGLSEYIGRVLAWDAKHGYHRRFWADTGDSYYGAGLIPKSVRFPEMLSRLHRTLGRDVTLASMREFFAPVAEELEKRYEPDVVWKGCLNPMANLVLCA